MDEGEMSFVVDIIKVVEVVVDLDRRKLAFVNDVLVAERADVEPIMEADFMGAPLAEDVQLSLESLFVKVCRRSRFIAGAIMLCIDNDRLTDDWLLGKSRRPENGAVTRDVTPSEHPQTKGRGDLLKGRLRFDPDFFFDVKEYVAYGVLARRREFEALVEFEFSLEESVGDGCHDPCAIAVSGIRSNGTPMSHVAQECAGWWTQLAASEKAKKCTYHR